MSESSNWLRFIGVSHAEDRRRIQGNCQENSGANLAKVRVWRSIRLARSNFIIEINYLLLILQKCRFQKSLRVPQGYHMDRFRQQERRPFWQRALIPQRWALKLFPPGSGDIAWPMA